MKLTLVRHGEAHPAGIDGNDYIRPLTEKGHQQAAKTATYLSKNLAKPDAFVVSPLRRAQETLAYIQQKFPSTPVFECDTIKPDDDAKKAVEWLSELEDYRNIVVVCHMNVVASIEDRLIHQGFYPFALAEARIYEQHVIAEGLSTLTDAFIPDEN
ncbi:phosphoglycerate mutase family protein [Acinetobacter apis]|uniref:Phosphohistidine phosphatase n=1 Tax=Acinetobacter apis TaxID=1229165 RepID=A0A217EDW4_9GAMM|nr:phosphoglycerate mutase family protein [Acinetobacter apis]SNQ28715.1 phosphohistidine phosphatase [Acinetobacter apis]